MQYVKTLILPNRFDYSYHCEFGELYKPLLEDNTCKEVVLDFSQVDYLDSSALGMMILLRKKFTGVSKKIKIKGAKGSTDEILKMANMQKLFEFM